MGGSPGRRLALWSAACFVAATVILSSTGVFFGVPHPMVGIVWRQGADRPPLESRFQLAEPIHIRDNEWAYVPRDTSRETFRAIVTHPSVAVTDGINRRTFEFVSSPPLSARRGGLLGGAPRWMSRAARLLGYLMSALGLVLLAGAALESSVLLPPTSRVRAAYLRLKGDPVGALRALPAWTRAAIERAAPVASPESAGLFRIVFGAAVLLFVLTEPIDPQVLSSYEVDATAGPYGALVRWLRAYPGIAASLGPWFLLSGGAFIGGLATPVSFAAFTVAFLLWASVFTLTASTHGVVVLGIALIGLLAARWGDAWSIDAWIRRRRGGSRALAPGRRYGFGIGVPRLVMAVALFAAAWSKVGGGLDWILNGTVKYHFVQDLDRAWVSWGPVITRHHVVAVALSAGAVAVEALLITAVFSRSETYRLLPAGASLALLAGFALFQGVLWWPWWILLMAFLPWERLRQSAAPAGADGGDATDRGGQRARPAPQLHTPPRWALTGAQVALLLAVIGQQLVMSAFHVEARPLWSAYDMYSTTYASADEYEDAINLVYRVVVFDGGRPREIADCVVDDRSAALLPTAAAGDASARARMRSLLAPCLEHSASVEAIALEGDKRVYNWDERRFERKRALDVIGPFPAAWLRE